MRKAFAFILAFVWLASAPCRGDSFNKVMHSSKRDQALQASFSNFPLLTPATDDDGKPAFQTWELDEPVNIKGVDFYGFRFKVTGRKNKEDLVWAYISSGTGFWYILPETGKPENFGFEEYFYLARSRYKGMKGLLPKEGKELVTQRLSGDELEDDKYYLIWFAFKSRTPAAISLKFTFADVPPEDAHKRKSLEQILDLDLKER